jgi:hypothetical protein
MSQTQLKPAPSRPGIEQEIYLYTQLREQLRAEIPDLDEDCLADTLEGLSTLPDLLSGVLRSHLDDVALGDALRSRIGDMRKRLSRIEVRAEKKKAVVATAMVRAEMQRLTAPEFTASLRSTPPAVVVLEEERIPGEYWKPQPPKLDKAALAVVLKSGQPVPGATLGTGGTTLSVRTK